MLKQSVHLPAVMNAFKDMGFLSMWHSVPANEPSCLCGGSRRKLFEVAISRNICSSLEVSMKAGCRG
jgi:hypothetical protein